MPTTERDSRWRPWPPLRSSSSSSWMRKISRGFDPTSTTGGGLGIAVEGGGGGRRCGFWLSVSEQESWARVD
jgi:hypothetical protein